VPALTYAVMNVISYKAFLYIDATVFAMIAQMKILTTALFAYPVLGRRQSCSQWRALIILTLAVTIITFQRGAKGTGVDVQMSMTFLIGVGLTFVEISLSGWISCYFEKYLKNGALTVWARNLQLAFWSLLLYLVMQLPSIGVHATGSPPASVLGSAQRVISYTLTPLPLILILLGGGGGLLVAFAIKYADAITKSIATTLSLLIVVGGEVVFFKRPFDSVIFMAAIIAIMSTQAYQEAAAPKVETTPALPESKASQKKGTYIPIDQMNDEELGELMATKKREPSDQMATVVGRS